MSSQARFYKVVAFVDTLHEHHYRVALISSTLPLTEKSLIGSNQWDTVMDRFIRQYSGPRFDAKNLGIDEDCDRDAARKELEQKIERWFEKKTAKIDRDKVEPIPITIQLRVAVAAIRPKEHIALFRARA